MNLAIFGALISAAVRARPDLVFIFCSHDLSLIDWLSPKALFTVKRSQVTVYQPEERIYEVYKVNPDDGIPEDVKRSILGVRKSVLFVEGDSSSDDLAVYGHLYKDRSVVAKGGWESVVAAVRVLRGNPAYHWMTVSGVIDNDGRALSERQALEIESIFCLSVPSIENLFFLEDVVASMCEVIHEFEGGKTPSDRISDAVRIIPKLLIDFKDVVVSLSTVWIANRILSERKVSLKSVRGGQKAIESVDVDALRNQELSRFGNVTDAGDLNAISSIAIKKTGISAKLSEAIGFADFQQYKAAVYRQIDSGSAAGKRIASAMRQKIPTLPSE